MLGSSTTPIILAELLNVNYAQLTVVAYKESGKSNYKSFSIPKKNGDTREICAPKDKLKNLQSRLKNLLEEIYEPHVAASAFICGRGLIYNAKRHVKKNFVFNIDLVGFYDQINFGRVRGILMSKPYSIPNKTATLIANICCLNNKLPQGAPTSPIISNMICRRMDRQLSKFAMENRAQYSRYADDITLSSRITLEGIAFKTDADNVEPSRQLRELIETNGFNINHKKTRLFTSNEKQVVTGLVVNLKVNVDRRYIRTTRAMIYSLSQGVDRANEIYWEKEPNKESTLQAYVAGRISYVGMIKGRDSSVFISLAHLFNSLGLKISISLKASSDRFDLERELHFQTPTSKKRLNDSVWIVEFDGVENADELIQGSAFLADKGRIITCAHTFVKAGVEQYCYVRRVGKSEKFRANIIRIDHDRDIAIMRFEDAEQLIPELPFLEFADKNDIGVGYRVSIVGFPEHEVGHRSVTVIPAKIINSKTVSCVDHFEVDKEIRAGNSGGPVLNSYMQVVGMASKGRSINIVENEVYEEGVSSFICAKHLQYDPV